MSFITVKSFETRINVPVDYRNPNSLGALGEKLFLEHVVPEMCKDCSVAISNLTAMRVFDKSFPVYPMHPICKLNEGKLVDCINYEKVIIVPKDVSIIELNVRLRVSISVDAEIKYRKLGEPYERADSLPVVEIDVITKELEDVVEIRNEVKNVVSILRERLLSKLLNEVLYLEEFEPILPSFDFICANDIKESREYEFKIVVELCKAEQSWLEVVNSRCCKIDEFSTRIRIPVTLLANARIFEVKTSLKHHKIDRSSLKELLGFKSSRDVDRYLENIEHVIKSIGARYYLVLVTPIPLYGKAQITVYELR